LEVSGGIRTALYFGLLSCHSCGFIVIWDDNLFLQSELVTFLHNSILRLCQKSSEQRLVGFSNGHFPMVIQGRDNTMGFWLLCAYLKKIVISFQHWCCGALAPPPCQLSNCTWGANLKRTDSEHPDWGLSPLRTPFLHRLFVTQPPVGLCLNDSFSGRHLWNIIQISPQAGEGDACL
jgi:hypothetical protein